MTQYGFYDNDIMDEVIASDMIHATSMGNFKSDYNNPWYSNSSYIHYNDKEDMYYSTAYDNDIY